MSDGHATTTSAAKYRTIVVDPPWEYGNSRGFSWRSGRMSGTRSPMLPYSQLSVQSIAELPVGDLADPSGCHLYLWTTQRFLWSAPDIASAWGFSISSCLVWCKTRRGFGLGGTFQSNTEFVIFCRRGRLPSRRRVDSQWFDWPDANKWEHSRKPEAFLDLVEQVSPGPYLELFARRQRLGWDTWGDEALQHVEVQA